MEIKLYSVVLNHRVVLHAIDATPARWRGKRIPHRDRARTAASSPRNDLVKNCRCTRRLVDFHKLKFPNDADCRLCFCYPGSNPYTRVGGTVELGSSVAAGCCAYARARARKVNHHGRTTTGHVRLDETSDLPATCIGFTRFLSTAPHADPRAGFRARRHAHVEDVPSV